MLNRDQAEKERRGYVEPKSIVYADGRERLVGKDWKKRKAELWERCVGYCEQIVGIEWSRTPEQQTRLVRCTAEADDPHHVIPRSKQRDDRLSNLQALCRFHHRLLDQRKVGGRSQKQGER